MLSGQVLFDAGTPAHKKLLLGTCWSPDISLGAALPFQAGHFLLAGLVACGLYVLLGTFDAWHPAQE